jgi:hypothetical protein
MLSNLMSATETAGCRHTSQRLTIRSFVSLIYGVNDPNCSVFIEESLFIRSVPFGCVSRDHHKPSKHGVTSYKEVIEKLGR